MNSNIVGKCDLIIKLFGNYFILSHPLILNLKSSLIFLKIKLNILIGYQFVCYQNSSLLIKIDIKAITLLGALWCSSRF